MRPVPAVSAVADGLSVPVVFSSVALVSLADVALDGVRSAPVAGSLHSICLLLFVIFPATVAANTAATAAFTEGEFSSKLL